jgi:hypothetical protein
MAWFHFCTGNHHEIGRATLGDMADWFEAGLLELGHKVTFSDSRVEPYAINLFWEYFGPEDAERIARSGVSYGIVATEIPDGAAFNWRREQAWKVRFDSFQEVAKRASFIWSMVESAVPFYSKFSPTAFLELGFSERLVPDYVNHEPENDFCFFGLRTPYREEAIEKIRKYAQVEWPDGFPSTLGVGKLIARSKIGLCFKQSEMWPIPSQTRLGRLMIGKRGVAAEYVPIPTRHGEIAGLCPLAFDFSDYALDLLHSDWKRRADEVFEHYRSRMPMRDILQDVLDRTVSDVLISKSGTSAASIDIGFVPYSYIEPPPPPPPPAKKSISRSVFTFLIPPFVEREIAKLFGTLGFVRVSSALWNDAVHRSETSGDSRSTFWLPVMRLLPPFVEREIGKLFGTLGFVRISSALWNDAIVRLHSVCSEVRRSHQ